MRLRTTLAALALTAGAAHAAPADDKSPATAMLLSLGSTAAGIAVTAVSADENSDVGVAIGLGVTVLGPSTGHWYAGEPATIGLAARVLGAGAFLYGAANLQLLCGLGGDRTRCTGDDSAPTFLAVGGALVLGGAIYDVATAPGAVARANDARRVSLAPTVVRGASHLAPGLALAGSF
jgi:hypothetical protein